MTLRVGESYAAVFAGEAQMLKVLKIERYPSSDFITYRVPLCRWFSWWGVVARESVNEFAGRIRTAASIKCIDEIEVL